jgi:hypothetical protein
MEALPSSRVVLILPTLMRGVQQARLGSKSGDVTGSLWRTLPILNIGCDPNETSYKLNRLVSLIAV